MKYFILNTLIYRTILFFSTPGAIVYDLNDYLSAYASYTEIYLPQDDYRDRTNKPLEPDEGKNYEIGLKGEFFDGRLNASLAYFEVHKKIAPSTMTTTLAAATRGSITPPKV